jgi:hypothetical protein
MTLGLLAVGASDAFSFWSWVPWSKYIALHYFGHKRQKDEKKQEAA